ncbi:GNAT family N-acetyltransferase [Lentzea sp. NEAU-D7]|uniref:GNAT family N-acetyltransferase n=1 Tax=Lentzea sp. NEAU-D7 TaxID=2994667 RepID=UPI00224B7D8D|nr:GNAT family N-acetyltransferase [Lentzea sp. NEAU-D7]MCX2947802.1 GNAT family N-acetyltransferase [Lentzea sp. NEAU-D7]
MTAEQECVRSRHQEPWTVPETSGEGSGLGDDVVDAARGRAGEVRLLGAPGRPRGAPDRPAEIRNYEPADEASWLRCRVLGFLATNSYDDVWQVKRRTDLELVALDGDEVAGILDVSVPGAEATIDTVVVHPGRQGEGIATALLAEAVPRLERCGVRTLGAWTREDVPALNWFARNGFTELESCLHVHASADEVGTVLTARHGLVSAGAFLHARIEREAEMRQRFERVHVCRRMARELRP